MRFKIPRGIIYFGKREFFQGLKCVLTGRVFCGEAIGSFEKAFAGYLGVKHAICVSSGKSALYLSLKALGCSQGDEVILPSYTVPEVAAVIISCGGVPRFVDIEAGTYNMSPCLLEKALNKRTKFILMTHLYGRPCDVASIISIALRHNLTVIEDAAQACGAEYRGKKTGSFGRIGYFSFGIYKNINTLGGGMLVTDEDDLAGRVRAEISSYSSPRLKSLLSNLFLCAVISLLVNRVVFSFLVHPCLGLLYRIRRGAVYSLLKNKKDEELDPRTVSSGLKVRFTNLQAELGLIRLQELDADNSRRAMNAERLNCLLSGYGIPVLPSSEENKNIYLNYVLCFNDRQDVARRMFNSGVDVTNGYIEACSALPQFSKYKTDCPVSEMVAGNNLYIPVHGYLTDADVLFVASALRSAVRR